jgi:hypothetical protein
LNSGAVALNEKAGAFTFTVELLRGAATSTGVEFCAFKALVNATTA